MNIRNFSPGDSITRYEPVVMRNAVYNHSLGIEEENSQMLFEEMGDEFTLIRFEHNCAYLQTFEGLLKLNLHPDFHTDWTEGWELFKAPEWSDKPEPKEVDPTPKSSFLKWFWYGILLASVSMLIICFSGIGSVFFFTYMAFYAASLLSFAYYITRVTQ